MNDPYLLERRRDTRLRLFGVCLGLLLAVLLHVAALLGPDVSYRPLLEEATVRRVLVVQPYRPVPPPPPPPPKPKTAGSGAPSAPKPPQPKPKPAAQQMAKPDTGAQSAKANLVPKGASSKSAAAMAPPDQVDMAEPEKTPDLDTDAATPTKPTENQWEKVLSELSNQSESLAAKSAQEFASAVSGLEDARGAGGTGQGGAGGDSPDGYLDPRIRISVASYPDTSVAEFPPAVPYPDLRFRQSQIETGICRVYYRVWVDGSGRITRRQLMSPRSSEDKKTFAPFIEAVRDSVEEWAFDRKEAELHIDVLFEIE